MQKSNPVTHINCEDVPFEMKRLRSARMPEQAIRLGEAALAKNPNDPDLLCALGITHKQRSKKEERDPERAVEYFNMALRINENHVDSLNQLGMIARTDNNIPEAKKYFAKALAADPKDTIANLNMGLIDLKEKHIELGLNRLRLANENKVHPPSLRVLKLLALHGFGVVPYRALFQKMVDTGTITEAQRPDWYIHGGIRENQGVRELPNNLWPLIEEALHHGPNIFGSRSHRGGGASGSSLRR